MSEGKKGHFRRNFQEGEQRNKETKTGGGRSETDFAEGMEDSVWRVCW